MTETGKRPLEEPEEKTAAEDESAPKTETEEKGEGEPAAKRTKPDEGEPAPEQATAPAPAPAPLPPPTDAPPPYSAVPPPQPVSLSSARIPDVLKPAVKAKLQWIFDTGKCMEHEVDTKIMMSLAEFSDAVGVQILEHFSDADMSTVRNKSAFLAGVMRRFRNEGRAGFGGGMGGGGYGGYGGPGMGGGGYMGGGGGAPGGGMPGAGGMGPPPSGPLAASVEAKLEGIYATGKCRREDVDQRCLDQLRSLPENAALEVVQKFSEADLATINSKSGFFMGIIKRFREQVFASDPNLTASAYTSLSPGIQTKLEALFSTHLVARSELDAKCYMELRNLPEPVAIEVVDKFCEANLSDIRNKTAFFLGILKRFKNEKGGGYMGGMPPPGMGPPPMGMGMGPPMGMGMPPPGGMPPPAQGHMAGQAGGYGMAAQQASAGYDTNWQSAGANQYAGAYGSQQYGQNQGAWNQQGQYNQAGYQQGQYAQTSQGYGTQYNQQYQQYNQAGYQQGQGYGY